jgi:hypothetical protein
LKWQGVLGSVLGEQPLRTPGDSDFVSKKRKQIRLVVLNIATALKINLDYGNRTDYPASCSFMGKYLV